MWATNGLLTAAKTDCFHPAKGQHWREMARSIVHTSQAPAAIGPYSQAVLCGSTLYTSGQIGIVPQTGELVAGGVGAQAEQVLANLEQVLQAAGASLRHVVKTTIYLTDMSDFAAVNEVYARYFQDAPPARSTVGVQQLPKAARVEIDAIAVLASP